MKKKQVILILINILMIVAMVIHVSVAMERHAQNSMNSAPAYVAMVDAIYYLIPLAFIDIVYAVIFKKRS